MILSKVIGTSVSTIQHPAYNGQKVLVVVPIHPRARTPIGHSFLAIDSANARIYAGVGDIVLASREGNAARQIVGDDKAPVHAIITGIVDRID